MDNSTIGKGKKELTLREHIGGIMIAIVTVGIVGAIAIVFVYNPMKERARNEQATVQEYQRLQLVKEEIANCDVAKNELKNALKDKKLSLNEIWQIEEKMYSCTGKTKEEIYALKIVEITNELEKLIENRTL